MFGAIIPAKNEEKSILAALTTILRLPISHIILVLNGCTDRTFELARSIPDTRIHILYFSEPLGIDIPRAIGALYARHLGVQGVLFVDGDMSGDIYENLVHLLDSIESGVDVALTNCYPYIPHRQKLANLVLRFRAKLNRELDLFKRLGLATPTHGPHALSEQALQLIPPEAVAIPPLTLYWAQKSGLSIKVATSIPHEALHSPRKHRRHARMIAETIIGDCIMGLSLVQNKPLSRSLGKHKLLGYHTERRFDLLKAWEQSLKSQGMFFEQHVIVPGSSRSISNPSDHSNLIT
ncbi:glycosyltransferase [Desulfosporosinus sp.]|uniref:glycosyltransferase family 2 protein n=1 Tax=Desulfosporosinus sp. TaxID=157907 RepID=UPI000E854D7A|nr:glycosyltransferase [Desulfosporosinus sp.]MBC2724009.1 glycosyltransferase [Desulfosporosinus sp.]MBC2727846.1 glycosyltransferase [Desulfosporosinus sp.]HBV86595.1 glycosyltransferase [Desulfosporosinus sp.]